MTNPRYFDDELVRCRDCDELKPHDDYMPSRIRKNCPVCRTCWVARGTAYKRANPDRARQHVAATRSRHGAKYLERQRAKYHADVEANRSRRRARDPEIDRRYREGHRDDIAAAARLRRDRQHGVTGALSDGDWRLLCELFDNRCLACGRKDVPLERDHVIPVTQGGSLELWNVQPLCRSCNASKGARHIDYREAAAFMLWARATGVERVAA
jgi:5-methylcytosine-specific restriction endonuclease McrA